MWTYPQVNYSITRFHEKYSKPNKLGVLEDSTRYGCKICFLLCPVLWTGLSELNTSSGQYIRFVEEGASRRDWKDPGRLDHEEEPQVGGRTHVPRLTEGLAPGVPREVVAEHHVRTVQGRVLVVTQTTVDTHFRSESPAPWAHEQHTSTSTRVSDRPLLTRNVTPWIDNTLFTTV